MHGAVHPGQAQPHPPGQLLAGPDIVSRGFVYVRTRPGSWEAYYDNGRAHSGYDVVEWAKRGVELGAGEILLMSVDNEGLQRGMDLELIEAVTAAVNVPVICGGGVGCGDDIAEAAAAGADAVACAAVLHYNKETVAELKEDIRAAGVEVRAV